MFKVHEIISAVGGKPADGFDFDDNLEFCSFSKDTRTIAEGDFYIPLVGEKFDGHDFITEAVRKGAAGFFLQRGQVPLQKLARDLSPLQKKLVAIEVDDTLLALQRLAAYNRDRCRHIRMVAVTGSVGKTSTKEMIAGVLEKGFKVLKTEGNLNNHIGLPLMLLKLKDQEICVIEMGMNNSGEISLLSRLAKPDIAVITNIGVAHIGNLGSQENIFKAKCEILEGMGGEKVLVVNGDDKYLNTLQSSSGDGEELKVIKYGIENSEAGIRASGLTNEAGRTVFTVDDRQYTLNCIGKHNVYNALCAMAVARELGLDEAKISEGYLSYENEKMRMQQIRLKNDILFINDAYNANYDSMKAGIEAVGGIDGAGAEGAKGTGGTKGAKGTKSRRKILVLGDMFELGEYSKELHRGIGSLINRSTADILVTCGKDAAEIAAAATAGNQGLLVCHYDNRAAAAEKLKQLIAPGDIAYFKASRGMKFEEIVNELIGYIEEGNMLKLMVIFGGQSSEHEISCISAGNILEHIDAGKYSVTKVGIDKAGRWFIFKGSNKSVKANTWLDESDKLEEVKDVFGLIKGHDVAFPVLHGKYGEDGTIQGLFELCETKYVGCGVLASSAGMDKEFTKLLAGLKGVPIVPFQVFTKGQQVTVDREIVGDYPLIVKPCNAGSSYGLTKVGSREELDKALENAFKYDSKLLVEKFIPAREIECAVLGNTELIVSEPGEILSANEIYDFDAKYNNQNSRSVIPAQIDSEQSQKIREYARRVYSGINARGLSRIDFFISKEDGAIYFNEVNTLPGFTDISMYPMMMQHSGISYSELIDRLIELARE